MRQQAQVKCRKCGRQIMIIIQDLYRKTIVDPEAVWIVPDPAGEVFVRIDGSKVRGREAPVDREDAEPAYRLHRGTCGGGS